MKKKKRSRGAKILNFAKNNKILVALILIVAILIFSVFGAKIALYVNFLVGNDIIVRLEADKEALFLANGEEENVTFEISVTTNPFCSALCSSSFKDISRDAVIEEDFFSLKPILTEKKQYLLEADRQGTGLALYRFDMECHSKKTFVCHTSEEPTTRSVFIPLHHTLNADENALKESLKSILTKASEKANEYLSRFSELDNTIAALHQIEFDLENEKKEANKSLQKLQGGVESATSFWEKQDYASLKQHTDGVTMYLNAAGKAFARFNTSVTSIIMRYDLVIDKLNDSLTLLGSIKEGEFISPLNVQRINESALQFNEAVRFVEERNTIDAKERRVNFLAEAIQKSVLLIEEQHFSEILEKELELAITGDALCEISGVCEQHPSLGQIAEVADVDLQEACARIDHFRSVLTQLNESVGEGVEANFPTTEEFWDDMAAIVANIKQNITNEYLKQLPENSSNGERIRNILNKSNLIPVSEYELNLTAPLIVSLHTEQPERCEILNASATELSPLTTQKISPVEIHYPLIMFEEQPSVCCVFGNCNACCMGAECSRNASLYPVLFLHGHSINEGTAADYSLEGFNSIQRKLEEEGYVNAGAITLFTQRDVAEGLLGFPAAPLTFRASYYFDIFQEPENYIVVQTKSENIDTYAIRLKELVETTTYKTGRPKVSIVAFSMGGLVARRYVQIFGEENVETLILIGTPNKGISDRVAGVCPLIGAELECRDMKSDSLFMNKLNRGPLPNIPVHNIVGTGCNMDGLQGDGVVIEKSAFLEGTRNYIINGTCGSRFTPLHLELRNINTYPRVYHIIERALKER